LSVKVGKSSSVGWHPTSTIPLDEERFVADVSGGLIRAVAKLWAYSQGLFMEFELKFRIHPSIIILVIKLAMIIING
jgi:hypothetical protein